jgi:hypothetical protein
MEGTPFLPLPKGMLIDQVQITENGHEPLPVVFPRLPCLETDFLRHRTSEKV